ncbi:MAG: hypothetical protein CM15mP69_2810 [Ectothiorhodospiraceae bacterium]|nr:MAG: hypothetical protein CM15mP69_2810 [Ectothiorhodospiraceae bacterium]
MIEQGAKKSSRQNESNNNITSTIIQQSDFLIEGHKIKKRIAVDTVANKIP